VFPQQCNLAGVVRVGNEPEAFVQEPPYFRVCEPHHLDEVGHSLP
jgi:hypothetical protein